MHFKLSTINDSTTFNDDDLFHRKELATSLTTIIKSTNDSLVISLEAEWGQGKTSFVKKWGHLLEEEGIKHLYIDAYKGDLNTDAFIYLASEIYTFAKNQLGEDSPALQSLKDKFISVGGSILKASSKTGLKVLTAGLFDDKAMDDFESNLAKELSSTANAFISNALNSYSEKQEGISELSRTLTDLAEELGAANKPFIVIIDELDRCRPSFALELLEVIKHLFSAKNVSFILVNNPKQMRESVKIRYGMRVDSGAYLRKFFDLSIPLPHGEHLEATRSEIRNFAATALLEAVGTDIQSSSVIADQIVEHYFRMELTLRDIEKIAITIALLRTVRGGTLISGAEILITVIVTLYVLDKELLKRIYNNQASESDIDNFFKFKVDSSGNSTPDARHHLFCLAFKDYDPSEFGRTGDSNAHHISQNRNALNKRLVASLLSIAM